MKSSTCSSVLILLSIIATFEGNLTNAKFWNGQSNYNLADLPFNNNLLSNNDRTLVTVRNRKSPFDSGSRITIEDNMYNGYGANYGRPYYDRFDTYMSRNRLTAMYPEYYRQYQFNPYASSHAFYGNAYPYASYDSATRFSRTGAYLFDRPLNALRYF